MLIIRLGSQKKRDQNDPRKRIHYGYFERPENMPLDLYLNELWEDNRGEWRVSKRAGKEKFVAFTYKNKVVLAARIEAVNEIEDSKRKVIEGTVLKPGDPFYDEYVGKESPIQNDSQNPISYYSKPGEERRCLCGCGELVSDEWVRGHDQKAIRERVEKIGTAADFIKWFDENTRHIDAFHH